MKTISASLRWTILLVLATSLLSGCKFWDPRTWRWKARPQQVQRWKYEAASPYAALAPKPQPPDRLIAVSGMGYGNSVGFPMADGRTIISESAPVSQENGPPEAEAGSPGAWEGGASRDRSRQAPAAPLESRIQPGVGREPAREVAAPPPPDPFANLPYGIPVPGKSGFVNLPDPYAGLPQIDVRGIAAGTPVEVPNPLQPAEKIRFRVP